MTAIEFPRLTQRQLSRIVDSESAKEALNALRIAAERTADVTLTAAHAVLRDPGDDAARDRLRDAVASREFVALVPKWTRELREVAGHSPDSGACTVATALRLWLWTSKHLRDTANVSDDLTDAISPLLAAVSFSLDVAGRTNDPLRRDLAHVYAAHASAVAAAACAELVFGYRRHLLWDAEGCATCYSSDDVEALEAIIPGFASGAGTAIDVLEPDGSHPAKRGPCADTKGLDMFVRLRNRLDACLTGSRIAKDRAAAALGRV